MTQDLWQLQHVRLGPASKPRLEIETLSIAAGVTAVLGESGAGKTSLLNLLVGFERPEHGVVLSRTLEVSGTTDRSRFGVPRGCPLALPDIAWVPADGGLWPQLSVREHIAGVLPNGATPLSGRATPVDFWLDQFDLSTVADQRPETLSMGERSRLSVARALASGAAVQVMDEPLVHVDAAHLSKYWSAIRTAISELNGSLIFATHAPEPVLREARDVVCLSQGQLVWHGTVAELYRRPPHEQVAAFLGPTNWLTPAETEQWLQHRTTEPVCIRPEQLEVIPQDGNRYCVEESHFSGSIAEAVVIDRSNNQRRTFYHRPPENSLTPGTSVVLRAILTGLLLTLGMELSGCGASIVEGHPLAVTNSRQYSLPPEGAMLPAPRGMTFGPNEELFILDNAGRVIVYDEQGQLARQWWMPEYSVGKPEGCCVMLDGRLAVADTHYHRVVFFDQQGTLLGMFGEEGHGPGQFVYTVDVTQDSHGNLYVAEYGGHDRVQKFTVNGEYLLEFGKMGTEPGEFQRASGVVWKDGVVYVADAINNRIQAFQDDGKFLRIVADAESVGLHYPYAIALGPDGTLFVAEYGASRVSQVSRDGMLLGQYGSPGRGSGQLYQPRGVAVSLSGKVSVGDTGNRRAVELQF